MHHLHNNCHFFSLPRLFSNRGWGETLPQGQAAGASGRRQIEDVWKWRAGQRAVADGSTGGPAQCWPPLAGGRHWVAPTIGAASHCGPRRVRPRQCGALDGATAIDLVIYIVHFLHPRSPPSQRCLKPAPNLQLYKCLSLYFLLLPYPSISIHANETFPNTRETIPSPIGMACEMWWSKNNTFMTYLMFYDCYDLCFRPSHLWCMMLEIER